MISVELSFYEKFPRLSEGKARRFAQPVVADEAAAAWSGRSADAALAILRQRLLAQDAQLPVLYRQYAGLCEPVGVRFPDFGVDPAFGGCVDGLVRVDLHEMRPAKRARYLARGGNCVHFPDREAMLQKRNPTLLNWG